MSMKIPTKDIMSPLTQKKHLACVGAFVKTALNRDYQLSLYYPGYSTVPDEKEHRSDEARNPFTITDLKTIFNPKNYLRHRNHRAASSARFWLPILGLYTGARLEELGQLHLSDIRQDPEDSKIWYLDINADTPDKSVKTKAGRRMIPLHPVLIKGGFLRRIAYLKKRREERLFPELTKVHAESSYTDPISQWFGNYVRRLSIGPKKPFHSFRHTFIMAFKSLQHTPAWTLVEEVAGHAKAGSESMTRYGGHRSSVKELYAEVITKLTYPGLDLSPLFTVSKYTTEDGNPPPKQPVPPPTPSSSSSCPGRR
jgi:integrase